MQSSPIAQTSGAHERVPRRLVAQVNCSSVEGPEARRDTPNMSSLSRSTSRSAPMEQADLMRPGYYLFSRLGKLVIDMEQAGNVTIFVLRGYAHSRACTSRAAIRWSSPNGQVQRPAAALCSIADWLVYGALQSPPALRRSMGLVNLFSSNSGQCRTPERHVARTSPHRPPLRPTRRGHRGIGINVRVLHDSLRKACLVG